MLRAGGILLSVLLAAALWLSGGWRAAELRLLDWQFGWLRTLAPKPVPADVVVVGIDEATTQTLREPLTLWHAHLGNFLQAAASGGASVIGLDVVLPDRSYDMVLPGSDRALLAGIVLARRSAPVILAVTVDPAGHTRPVHPAFLAAAGPEALGYALLPEDEDGMLRRFDERLEYNGSAVPTLAGQMARRLGKPVESGWIDYVVGPPMRYLPLQEVLAWWSQGNTAALQSALAGKAVLLGSVLKYEDRHRAPVNLVGWDMHADNLPGVMVHAQVLRNLLHGGLVQAAPSALLGALLLAAALTWLRALRPAYALALVLALAALGLAAATASLHRGIYLPVATVLLLACAGVAGRQAFTTVQQLRERLRLRGAFGGYVSPPVMRQILDGQLKPTLGGERRYCCVMFSDIRGYTTRSEHSSPEQTIGFLNRYFDRVVPVIHAYGGTVVSFMGDGIMAVFGAPNALPNPCESAYIASVAMLAQLRAANIELMARGEEPIRIGIGLHAGEGVSGHVGSSARHEYSVIGDVTNVASRLESLTKEVGYQLVCSAAVAEQLPQRGDLVALGPHAVKGRAAVDIFGAEPVGDGGS
ncbi:MAG: adenylate/guanylate cyclase domain-containing protein [Burkholderiaceae bacterium]